MPKPALNDLSREEIAKALAGRPPIRKMPPRPCRLCGDSFAPTREWQHFCSSAHQKEWNKREPYILAERLAQRLQILERENAELRAELARLAPLLAKIC